MSGYRYFDPEYDDFLMHYRTPGSKNGVRLYQYPDGTWTELGKERRRVGRNKKSKRKFTNGDLRFYKTIRKDLDEINKADKNDSAVGRSLNCTYCSVAMELRRRGADPNAKAPASENLVEDSEVLKLFGKKSFNKFALHKGTGYSMAAMKVFVDDSIPMQDKVKAAANATFTKSELRAMEKELVSQGNGARGILAYKFVYKGRPAGHMINYEIANDSLYVIDAQAGTLGFGLDGRFDKALGLFHLRTDNAIMDIEASKKFLSK